MPDYTIDIGYVHVGKPVSQRAIEGVWECADDCPHPDHRDIEAPSHPGRERP